MRSGALDPLSPETSRRWAEAPARGKTGRSASAPIRFSIAPSMAPIASGRWIMVKRPPGLRIASEARIQPMSGAPPVSSARRTCARARAASGDARTARASKNGGLVTTASASSSPSPASRRARASRISSARIRTRSVRPFRAALPAASRARPASISTRSALRQSWRPTSASPTAPIPAPTSTTRPSAGSAAAASRAASEPTRCPSFGCMSVNRPPSHRSDDSPAGGHSGASPGGASAIAQLAGEPSLRKQAASPRLVAAVHKNSPGKEPERAFHRRHMLVGDEKGDAFRLQERFDHADQHKIVRPQDFDQQVTLGGRTCPVV